MISEKIRQQEIVIASAAKQSIERRIRWLMDCFVAEPVIGRAFARPVGSQEEIAAWQDARHNKTVVARLDRAIQYAAASRLNSTVSGNRDRGKPRGFAPP